MQKGKGLFYAAAFLITLLVGMVFGKNPTYPCEFEKTVILDTEDAEEKVTSKAEMPPEGVININTATAYELTALSGIGEKTSKKIVDYREENGGFETCEELLKVPGIGEKKYEQIKENISVK